MNKEENKKLNIKIIIYGVSICVLFGIAVKLFISITDASMNEDLRIVSDTIVSNVAEIANVSAEGNDLNWWMIIAIIEFVVIVILLLSRKTTKYDGQHTCQRRQYSIYKAIRKSRN